MDKLLCAHQTKPTKKIKPKVKKPIKVVYISNPMKVKTSASEFRALVQELTGQDSDMPVASVHGPATFPELEDAVPGHGKVPDGDGEEEVVLDHVSKVVQVNNARICNGSDVVNYEGYGSSSLFDMAQVMGSGLYYSSDLWC